MFSRQVDLIKTPEVEVRLELRRTCELPPRGLPSSSMIDICCDGTGVEQIRREVVFQLCCFTGTALGTSSF
jgi:hypothetical protein